MRRPDQVIGPRAAPQMLRWDLWKWRGFQVALHKWCHSDYDRALHDHKAANISVLLTGCYVEILRDGPHLRLPLVPYFRRAQTLHRIQLAHGPVWTLWIRFPPWREWGFMDGDTWVPAARYIKEHGLEWTENR